MDPVVHMFLNAASRAQIVILLFTIKNTSLLQNNAQSEADYLIIFCISRYCASCMMSEWGPRSGA